MINPLLPPIIRSRTVHTIMTSWLTPYGRVNAIFSSTPKASVLGVEEASRPKDIIAAKFVLIPAVTSIPFCIEFCMNLEAHVNNPSNSIKVNYHAIRPDDSEIFRIASYGSVQELRDMLTNKTARLTDRDTDGRSLLGVGKSWILFDGKTNCDTVRNLSPECGNVQVLDQRRSRSE